MPGREFGPQHGVVEALVRRLEACVQFEVCCHDDSLPSRRAGMKKVKASMMNAIHDLPLLVARDEGFFRDEGLDVEILKTPGSGQRDSDHQALRANIFERTMEALYDQGECDQFRMCEWGVMKRAVESNQENKLRTAKIVALGSAMSS